MKKYKQIDISGDVGLRIKGKSLKELIINAAEGLSSLITDESTVHETETRNISIVSDNKENLLVQWLNELVFLFDTYGFIGKIFSLNLKGNSLKAEIRGSIFDPEKNESRLLIKAATYHNLTLKKKDSSWEATVIFDI